MLVQFIGSRPAYQLTAPQSLVFDQGVPTWIPDALYPHLSGEFFRVWQPGDDCVAGRPIMIEAPARVDWLWSVLRVIRRAQECFPFNVIHLCAPAEFLSLVQGVEVIPSYDGAKRASYYRLLELSDANIKAWASLPALNTQHISTRMLMVAGLWRAGDELERPLAPWTGCAATTDESVALLVHGSMTARAAAEKLQKMIPQASIVGEGHGPHIDAIRRAKIVVSCGASPYGALAQWLGKPLFLLKPNDLNEIDQLQYTWFANADGDKSNLRMVPLDGISNWEGLASLITEKANARSNANPKAAPDNADRAGRQHDKRDGRGGSRTAPAVDSSNGTDDAPD